MIPRRTRHKATPESQDTGEDSRAFRSVMRRIFRLYGTTREYFFPWGASRLIGSVGVALLNVFQAYYIGRMVVVALSRDYHEVLRYSIIMVAMIIARVVLSYVNILTQQRYSYLSGRKLRRLAVEKINSLPICYFERTHTGRAISKLGSDLDLLESFFGDTIAGIWGYLPTHIIISFILLARVDLPLTLICGTAIPVFGYLIGRISLPMAELSKQRQEHIATYNSLIRDFVEGAPIYKVYNMQRTFLPKFRRACEHVAAASFAIARRRTVTQVLNTLGMVVPQIIAVGAGMVFVATGRITIGQLFVFSNVLFPFVSNFRKMNFIWSSLVEHAGRGEHFFSLLDTPSERTNPTLPMPDIDLTGRQSTAIRFADVSFSYRNESKLLDDMSFSIPRGSRTALVGASGCGKSTVHKLVCGYYDDYTGTIELFGRSLADWNLDDLRSKIAVVSQDVFLFNDTVLENIRYGRTGASDEEVYDAARRAGCWEFVEELSEGFDTGLGERGHLLSGGQQQRISVARALLRDVPLVLLDEPTSALDTRAEARLQQAIAELEAGRTVFVIAHRLSTIVDADEILVLDEGGICDRGTHDELVARSPRYRALYQRQVVEEVAP